MVGTRKTARSVVPSIRSPALEENIPRRIEPLCSPWRHHHRAPSARRSTLLGTPLAAAARRRSAAPSCLGTRRDRPAVDQTARAGSGPSRTAHVWSAAGRGLQRRATACRGRGHDASPVPSVERGPLGLNKRSIDESANVSVLVAPRSEIGLPQRGRVPASRAVGASPARDAADPICSIFMRSAWHHPPDGGDTQTLRG
jgi:hypothetical protein